MAKVNVFKAVFVFSLSLVNNLIVTLNPLAKPLDLLLIVGREPQDTFSFNNLTLVKWGL